MTKNNITKISEKVYQMGDPFYQVYLVRGKSCALVEPGLTYTVPKVVAGIEELGISPEEIHYLIITHAHFDHVCGVPGLLRAFPNLRTVASPVAARVLTKEKVVAGHFTEDKAVVETLLRKGLLKDYDGSFPPPSIINVDMIMNEGDILDLGDGCKLAFSLTPGHSPDSMTCYLSLGEVLFPSDVFGYVYSKDIFPMYLANFTDYINSIKKVSAIEASILAFPHSPVISGKNKIREFIPYSLKIAEEVHSFIIKNYQNSRSFEDISQELFKRFYIEGWAIQSAALLKISTDLLVRRSLEAENIAYTK
jgi:glyoxylase-like metal-dependent hydrolase (beta-lactamase superfamily II)